MQEDNPITEAARAIIDREEELNRLLLPEHETLAVAVFESLRQLVSDEDQNVEHMLFFYLKDLDSLLDAYQVILRSETIIEETKKNIITMTQKIHDVLVGKQ